MSPRWWHRIGCVVVAGDILAAAPSAAQEMEPRAYSASPVGAIFLVVGYSWSSGNVVFDPALPLSDVHADVQGGALAIGHSFDLFGKLALATATLPYAMANVSGKIFEQQSETARSGLADVRVKLSVNLRGNPALLPREFGVAPRRTVIGASLSLTAPAGQDYQTEGDQSRHQPVELQAGGGYFGAERPLGSGWLPRRVVLHREPELLPERIDPDAGPDPDAAGPRQLYRQAAIVARRRRHV